MSHARRTESAPEVERLRARFALATSVALVEGRRYELLRPRNIDDLISEEDFALDERIPYWAECWPSARILAQRVARLEGRGRTLLELGCGIGLVSLAAAQAGFEVLATDYYADALEFTEANARLHGLSNLDTRLVDWRKLPADLGTFDVVAASDVLYEQPQAAIVAAALQVAMARGAQGWLSDPLRRPAPAFVHECRARGLSARCVERVPTEDDGAALTIAIYEIRRG